MMLLRRLLYFMALLLSVACVCVAASEETKEDGGPESGDGDCPHPGKTGLSCEKNVDMPEADRAHCADPSENKKCTAEDHKTDGECLEASKTCLKSKDPMEPLPIAPKETALLSEQLRSGGTLNGTGGAGGNGMGRPGNEEGLSPAAPPGILPQEKKDENEVPPTTQDESIASQGHSQTTRSDGSAGELQQTPAQSPSGGPPSPPGGPSAPVVTSSREHTGEPVRGTEENEQNPVLSATSQSKNTNGEDKVSEHTHSSTNENGTQGARDGGSSNATQNQERTDSQTHSENVTTPEGSTSTNTQDGNVGSTDTTTTTSTTTTTTTTTTTLPPELTNNKKGDADSSSSISSSVWVRVPLLIVVTLACILVC
ncbi:uncharacterized protein TM35_001161050 [Trypanosoma theileri]|uniref:Mucin-associated surface protein (MASP) n=1 Tax=Trypanosoma theileri TaxID=67003 RepID=A0A1X0NDV7_9TRYP|nr:uncharacterized protein TM35_001161050 [Trypanosoma theileri]ORC81430.1 hypothetical protein TM35_001161050 [Trypanosoma theileri]